MLRFEFSETIPHAPDLDHIGLTDADVARLASCQPTTGYWRADMATGHVFWSPIIFAIYGMAPVKGPVNLKQANEAVHPDDLPYMLKLIEQAAADKTGFHYVLRLKDKKQGYKFVRSIARYRVTADGREELFGMFEEIAGHARLIGVVGTDNPSPQVVFNDPE